MFWVSIVLLVIASLIAFANVGGSIDAARRHRKGEKGGYSYVPLLSLICSAGAWALARDTIGFWAFVPAVLDPGTWVLVALPGAIINSYRRERD